VIPLVNSLIRALAIDCAAIGPPISSVVKGSDRNSRRRLY
jgi:hypothetical protein